MASTRGEDLLSPKKDSADGKEYKNRQGESAYIPPPIPCSVYPHAPSCDIAEYTYETVKSAQVLEDTCGACNNLFKLCPRLWVLVLWLTLFVGIFVACGLIIHAALPGRSSILSLYSPINARAEELMVVGFASFFIHNVIGIAVEHSKLKQQLIVLSMYVNAVSGIHGVFVLMGWSPMIMGYNGSVTPLRFLMWFFTLPALIVMVHLFGLGTHMKLARLVVAESMIVLNGFLAELLPFPYALPPLAVALICFLELIKNMREMFHSAMEGNAKQSCYILKLTSVWVQVTWSIFPCFFMLRIFNALDHGLYEILMSVLHYISKVTMTALLVSDLCLSMEEKSALALAKQEKSNQINIVQKLKQVMKDKDKFLSETSHELRTPLHGILGLSSALLNGAYGELGDEIERTIKVISLSSGRLLDIINNFLDSATLRQNKAVVVKQDEVLLKPVLQQSMQLLSLLVRPGVELSLSVAEDVPAALGDESRISQIMSNLLGNAIKFTEKGRITVTATLQEKKDMILISVEDTGIGIPENAIQSIFTPFKKVDDVITRRYGGTGLGLSLVHSLVHAHNGTISVHSTVNVGSTFSFTIPVAKNSQAGQPGSEDKFDIDERIDFRNTATDNLKRQTPTRHTTTAHQPKGRLSYPNTDALNTRRSMSETLGFQQRVARKSLPVFELQLTSSPLSIKGSDSFSVEVNEMQSTFAKCRSNEGSPRLPLKGNETSSPFIRSNDTKATQMRSVGSEDSLSSLFSVGFEKHKLTHKEVHGHFQVMSIDDEAINHMVLEGFLKPNGFTLICADSGPQALQMLDENKTVPDIILLDVMMPGMSGYEVCQMIREKFPNHNIPIIMVSAKSSEDDIVKGLTDGSNDYIAKPFKQKELLARIKTQLSLFESWKIQLEAVATSELLHKILPKSVITRLKKGTTFIADEYHQISILFSDIVGFTTLASITPTKDVVGLLNDLFNMFDSLVDLHQIYKVETIGDAYMAASGHDGAEDHAQRLFKMAHAMIRAVTCIRYNESAKEALKSDTLNIRLGLHSGPAYAGVVGQKCPRFCFFGDTVNTASRMESTGFPMCIQMSEAFFKLLDTNILTDFQGKIGKYGQVQVKGKGLMTTYVATVFAETPIPEPPSPLPAPEMTSPDKTSAVTDSGNLLQQLSTTLVPIIKSAYNEAMTEANKNELIPSRMRRISDSVVSQANSHSTLFTAASQSSLFTAEPLPMLPVSRRQTEEGNMTSKLEAISTIRHNTCPGEYHYPSDHHMLKGYRRGSTCSSGVTSGVDGDHQVVLLQNLLQSSIIPKIVNSEKITTQTLQRMQQQLESRLGVLEDHVSAQHSPISKIEQQVEEVSFEVKRSLQYIDNMMKQSLAETSPTHKGSEAAKPDLRVRLKREDPHHHSLQPGMEMSSLSPGRASPSLESLRKPRVPRTNSADHHGGTRGTNKSTLRRNSTAPLLQPSSPMNKQAGQYSPPYSPHAQYQTFQMDMCEAEDLPDNHHPRHHRSVRSNGQMQSRDFQDFQDRSNQQDLRFNHQMIPQMARQMNQLQKGEDPTMLGHSTGRSRMAHSQSHGDTYHSSLDSNPSSLQGLRQGRIRSASSFQPRDQNMRSDMPNQESVRNSWFLGMSADFPGAEMNDSGAPPLRVSPNEPEAELSPRSQPTSPFSPTPSVAKSEPYMMWKQHASMQSSSPSSPRRNSDSARGGPLPPPSRRDSVESEHAFFPISDSDMEEIASLDIYSQHAMEKFLHLLGLERYTYFFRAEEIDLKALSRLHADQLRDLGIRSKEVQQQLAHGLSLLERGLE